MQGKEKKMNEILRKKEKLNEMVSFYDAQIRALQADLAKIDKEIFMSKRWIKHLKKEVCTNQYEIEKCEKLIAVDNQIMNNISVYGAIDMQDKFDGLVEELDETIERKGRLEADVKNDVGYIDFEERVIIDKKIKRLDVLSKLAEVTKHKKDLTKTTRNLGKSRVQEKAE